MARKMCRHCGQKPSIRPRGLCWGCYYTPGVRDHYPVSNHCGAKRSAADFYGNPPTPPVATKALAGSTEKVAVMEERAALGYAIHHPDDTLEVVESHPHQGRQPGHLTRANHAHHRRTH